jgi:hypothetical protein
MIALDHTADRGVFDIFRGGGDGPAEKAGQGPAEDGPDEQGEQEGEG